MPVEAPTSHAYVQIQSLTKSFDGDPPVLQGIDLTVAEGEFISLIGPSGCGKTTLLRILAGLEVEYTGTVTVNNKAPENDGKNSFFIFQEPTLLPWLKVQANVELALKIKDVPDDQRRLKVDEMIRLVGLEEARNKYPRQLSGGMAMRVSIARALSTSPRILYMDEPFGALDEMTRDRLNEDLLRIRQDDPFTAFYVTHSVAEAVFLSTKIVVLAADPGRIEQVIEVPFIYPRTAELREKQDYLELLAQTSHALRGTEKQ
jgi:NitT/TauT family transport system ATP-binding protein